MRKNLIPLLISHHPICEYYAKDMIGTKRPICRGCIFFYPALLLAGIIFLVFPLHEDGVLLHLGIGLLLLASYGLKVLIKNLPQILDDAIHLATGIGISLICIPLFQSHVAMFWKIFVPIQIQLAMAFASYRRIIKVDKICQQCPHFSLGKNCPGYTQTSLPPPHE